MENLKNLKPMFLAGSKDWNFLECLLVTWPLDQDDPPQLPAEHDSQYAIPEGRITLPDGHESLPFSAIPVGTAELDRDGARFRDGFKGMFIIRGDFGDHIGGRRHISNVDEANDCGERFMFLAGKAASLLKSPTRGVSENALKFPDHRRWILALFDLLPEFQSLTTRSGKPSIMENGNCLLIRDLFLASAEAIDIIIGNDLDVGAENATSVKDKVPLTKRQQDIVDECDGKLVQIADLAAAVNCSDRTTKDECTFLESKGILHRPQGERKGFTKVAP